MSAPLKALAELAERGVALAPAGADLKVTSRAPLAPCDRAMLKTHKPGLLALLSAPVFLDLETRSAADIKEVGGRAYAQHPSTEIITAVALMGGRVVAWAPGLSSSVEVTWPGGHGEPLPVEVFPGRELPEPLALAIRAGLPLCAHNAFGFDAF